MYRLEYSLLEPFSRGRTASLQRPPRFLIFSRSLAENNFENRDRLLLGGLAIILRDDIPTIALLRMSIPRSNILDRLRSLCPIARTSIAARFGVGYTTSLERKCELRDRWTSVRCSLFAVRCSLFAVRCSLLAVRCRAE
jgi:hypothetical protein